METYDWHFLDAFKVTMRYLHDNSRYWAGNEHVAESVAYLDPVLQEIARRAQLQQGTQPEGYTDAKDAALDAMLARGWKTCRKLKVFARKSGNLVLLQELNFSRSTFDDGTEEEQAGRCRLIAERAETHLPRLAAYRITTEEVTALKAAIDAFAPLETERDAVADQRKLLTASLGTLLRSARAKLRELDEEIEAFFDEEADAEFIEGYKEARRVSRIKPRRAAPEGQGS